MNSNLTIRHVLEQDLQTLISKENVDCLIADSEDGFSQLGSAREFLSEDLGYPDTSLLRYIVEEYPDRLEPSIGQLAGWCRSRSPEITLVVIPSRRLNSKLKGLILSPYDGANSYLQFANGEHARPHRDFFYSVTWGALYQAVYRLGSRSPALMHMSRVRTWRNEYKWEATFCQVEAGLNFSEEHQGCSELIFWDTFPGNFVAKAVQYFHGGKNRTSHRPFTHYSTEKWGIHFVTISWGKPPFSADRV